MLILPMLALLQCLNIPLIIVFFVFDVFSFLFLSLSPINISLPHSPYVFALQQKKLPFHRFHHVHLIHLTLLLLFSSSSYFQT